MKRHPVWDVPVRLYHWLLVVGFLFAYVIAEFADDDGPVFVLHMALGLVLGLATVLRILWALVGTRYARFSGFDLRPSALVAYLRSLLAAPGAASTGHNPATSYAVLGMFVALLGLPATGLAMAFLGLHELKELHEVLVVVLLALIAAHLVGLALHSYRHRDGIARSMFDGKKPILEELAIASSHRAVGLAGLAVVLLFAAWLLAGYDSARGRLTFPGTTMTLGGEGEDEEAEEREPLL